MLHNPAHRPRHQLSAELPRRPNRGFPANRLPSGGADWTRHGPSIGRSLVGLALGITLSACGQQVAHVDKPAAIVAARTVLLTDFAPQLTLTGVVQARSETQLSFRRTGQIVHRSVDVGDHVTAGQQLASMDDASQQADVRAAQAALDAATAQVTLAQASFDRQDALLTQGVTTRSSFDAAQTALQTAQGSREAAQAELDSAKEALSYSSLIAPVAGVITERDLEDGEVAPAASTVFTLAEDGPRDAVFNVQEAVFLGETADLNIDLTFTSDPAVKATGTVREISPALDPQTGTVLVKVGIDNPPPGMTLGGSVTGMVSASPTPKAVLPWSALWSSDGEPSVWIIDPQTKAVSLQPVTVRTYQTASVVIESGLEAGQVVVTQGGKMLAPGQVVTVAEGDAP